MTSQQIIAALDQYLDFYGDRKPERFPPDYRLPTEDGAIQHALWMCREAKTFAQEKPEKAMRWLGFIQGVLWSLDGWTIDEFKADNRSAQSDTCDKDESR